MKVLATKIKKETGEYVPIEDVMSHIIAERYSHMTQANIATVLGPDGEGQSAGKLLERQGEVL